MQSRWMLLNCLMLCSSALLAQANDSLQDLRDVVRPPAWDSPAVDEEKNTAKPTTKSRQNRDDDHNSENCWENNAEEDDDSLLVGDFILLAGVVVTAPVWLPHEYLEDDAATMTGYFPAHPYADPRGYMIISPDTLPNAGWFTPYTQSWRAASEYGTSFGKQEFVGGKWFWEHTSRFGIDTRFIYLKEKRIAGDNDLWLGDTNLLFRFAQHEKLQFRGGLGFNWLSEDARADLGVNFSYGVNWYPKQPWILSAELDLGTLGKGHLFHWQNTIGCNWRHAEGYIGYDYTDIGTAQYHFFLAGVRGWF